MATTRGAGQLKEAYLFTKRKSIDFLVKSNLRLVYSFMKHTMLFSENKFNVYALVHIKCVQEDHGNRLCVSVSPIFHRQLPATIALTNNCL
jgi:hypothetical protein